MFLAGLALHPWTKPGERVLAESERTRTRVLLPRPGERLEVRPVLVPQRDEHSETVGDRIAGPGRAVLFIPDVDKWEKMPVPIEDLMRDVDVALLDGTFFSGDELPSTASCDPQGTR